MSLPAPSCSPRLATATRPRSPASIASRWNGSRPCPALPLPASLPSRLSLTGLTSGNSSSRAASFRNPGRNLPPSSTASVLRYFDVFQTRLLAGRTFNEGDILTSPKVFIISQATATALFGKEDPIGRRIAQTGIGNAQWGEIVGIARRCEIGVARSGSGDAANLPADGAGSAALQRNRGAHDRCRPFDRRAEHPRCDDPTRPRPAGAPAPAGRRHYRSRQLPDRACCATS